MRIICNGDNGLYLFDLCLVIFAGITKCEIDSVT